jgi:hypothetical protein
MSLFMERFNKKYKQMVKEIEQEIQKEDLNIHEKDECKNKDKHKAKCKCKDKDKHKDKCECKENHCCCRGKRGKRGKTGERGKRGPAGPAGPAGGTGPTGATGSTGPGGTTIYLATDQSIANNQFLGIGTAESSPQRTSVVIGQNMTLSGLVFSTRNNTFTTATATVFRSTNCGATFQATDLAVTVNSPACFGIDTGSVPVNIGDLITVQINTGGPAFANGVAATILFTIP